MIREAGIADRDAILALRERCFGGVDLEKRDPRFWDWEFASARLFVGGDGALATHIALVPVPYAIDGAIVQGAMAVDAMTAPAARGQGWFTRAVGAAMESTRNDFAIATAYQIRDAVLGAMLRNGWRVAEKVPVLVRPAPLFRTKRDPRVREVWSAAAMPPLWDFEERRHGRRTPDVSIARTEAFLQWRFFENPHWRYRVTAVGDEAYLVARRTRLKGFDTYAIADLRFRSARAARILLRDAVAEAKRIGCTLTAALVSRDHPAFRLFLMRGFLPGPHWFRLLVHPMSGGIDVASLRWRVMWADTDHL